MAFPALRERQAVFVPADYTANETATIIPVHANEVVVWGTAKQLAAYNGAGTDAILILGDGGDTNRFMEAGEIDETSATDAVVMKGVGLDNPHMYTSDDTIDVGFTANTSGTRNAGSTEFRVVIWRAFP